MLKTRSSPNLDILFCTLARYPVSFFNMRHTPKDSHTGSLMTDCVDLLHHMLHSKNEDVQNACLNLLSKLVLNGEFLLMFGGFMLTSRP